MTEMPQDQGNAAAPPPPPPPPPPEGEAPVQGLTQDEKTMGMLCHLLAIFTGFLGPLIIWLIKKDQSNYVDYHGKQALNLQISVIIYFIGAFILSFIVIGVFLFPVIAIGNVVLLIIGTIKANNGIMYKYPVALQLLK